MTSNNEQAIQEIRVDLAAAKAHVDMADTIRRLEKNPDFRRVFTDGYFRDEASRLTLLLGDQNITEEDRAKIQISLRCIGELHTYLRVKLMLGEQMANAIADGEREIDELLEEDARGDDPNAEGSDAE